MIELNGDKLRMEFPIKDGKLSLSNLEEKILRLLSEDDGLKPIQDPEAESRGEEILKMYNEHRATYRGGGRPRDPNSKTSRINGEVVKFLRENPGVMTHSITSHLKGIFPDFKQNDFNNALYCKVNRRELFSQKEDAKWYPIEVQA